MLAQFWHALTAAGRLFALGAVEAWGFWSTTLLLLGLFIFSMETAGGIFWRLIEGRLRPKLRDRDAEALLRGEIRSLKAELYDSRKARTALEAANADLARTVEAWNSWSRNMAKDGAQAPARR